MAGATTWPGSVDAFTYPASSDLLSNAPGHAYILGSALLAITAIENWLDAPPVNVVPASGSTETLPDPRIFPLSLITVTANCTFTFPAATAGHAFDLALIQGTGAPWIMTWGSAGTVRWNGGAAPVLSTGVGAIDIITFKCFATHWYGFTAGLGMA